MESETDLELKKGSVPSSGSHRQKEVWDPDCGSQESKSALHYLPPPHRPSPQLFSRVMAPRGRYNLQPVVHPHKGRTYLNLQHSIVFRVEKLFGEQVFYVQYWARHHHYHIAEPIVLWTLKGFNPGTGSIRNLAGSI